jgi:3-dehydroquinate synthase
LVAAEDCERIEALLQRAGLPIEAPGVDPEDVLSRMQLDKKAGRSGLKVILLEAIGRGVVAPAPDPKVLERVLGG